MRLDAQLRTVRTRHRRHRFIIARGGPSAHRLIRVVRAYQLRVMCGCAAETTHGIAAAAPSASLRDDAPGLGVSLVAR